MDPILTRFQCPILAGLAPYLPVLPIEHQTSQASFITSSKYQKQVWLQNSMERSRQGLPVYAEIRPTGGLALLRNSGKLLNTINELLLSCRSRARTIQDFL